jgi:predicted Zn-dependent protease
VIDVLRSACPQTRRIPAGAASTLSLAMLLLILLLMLASQPAAAAENELPALGDKTSGTISPEAERRLGAAWLRELRARTPLFYDPLVNDYVEHLAYRIASHSDLIEPRLNLVILNSGDINAFAVPGGVLGINAGLLLNAQTEDEVAAVLAHELAHLSQRHYARSLEQQRQSSPLALTALLASILVAATVGGDAGAAAILSTQAGMLQAQLAHSREHEREADRIGMQALARAGFSPAAMPAFFEKLQKAAPLDPELYPEFLRTHPITESRISDSRNRAQQLAVSGSRRDSLDFTLARARTLVAFARENNALVADMQAALQRGANAPEVRYTLALALLRAQRFEEALNAIAPLRADAPERIAYRVAEAEILLALDRSADAAELLTNGLAVAPDNFPLAMIAAQALLRAGRAERAVGLLERQSLLRPGDPSVWQQLARARGERGDSAGVHAARAEYFFLRGQLEQAREQFELGIGKAGKDFVRAAPLRTRLLEIEEIGRQPGFSQ